jgi:hypothetical protein
MQKAAIYIRILTDQIPEQQREKLAFREDRNYLVIAIDPEKNRMLLPDDHNRMVWMPMGVLRFVKIA